MAIVELGDRKYKIIIHLGYDGKKRKTKSKRVNLQHLSIKQAEKEIIVLEADFEREVKGNPTQNKDMKFSELVDLFMKDHAELNLRPKTVASYNEELKRRIIPEFGYMKINEIKPLQLVKFYSKLSKQTYMKGKIEVPLSKRTIYYQHQIMSSILGQAVEWQLLKENPCQSVKPPRPKKSAKINKEKQWEVEEALTFLDFIQEESLKYRCAVELALIGGLRTEEILGLDINDIHSNGVSIVRTSKLVEGMGMVVEELAKNDTSERFVVLPEIVIDDLKKLRAEQRALQFKLQDLWQDIKIGKKYRILLFTQANGKPMHGKTIYHWFKGQIEKYNKGKKEEAMINDISIHGLRHTSASLISLLGGQSRAGARRFGHAAPSTFLNMYGGAQNKEDQEISDKLGELLLKKRETGNQMATKESK